jgi:Protein of unknown function (DUF3105)
MAERRQDKQALRQERERREAEAKAAERRKRLLGVAGAAALAVAAIVIVVVVTSGGNQSGDPASAGDTFPSGGSVPKQQTFDLQQAAAAAGCELKSNKAPSRDVNHLTDPDQPWPYKQNPPTSGRHFQIPAEDGLYNGPPPPDTALVHALEHGRVDIWAKPSLPVDQRKQIRALFDEDSYQMIVVRRSNMPYAVAATAWSRDPRPDGTGRLLGCARWSDGVIDALRAFRDEHRSDGPEDIP